jgi:hypothetical protein
MPLPTPIDLHARVTEIISSTANCPASWEQLAEYITGLVDAYRGEKTA